MKKKLKEIQDLEARIKNKEIQPNDAQQEKVAGKAKLDTELNEVQDQVQSYVNAKKINDKSFKKELDQARRETVKKVS